MKISEEQKRLIQREARLELCRRDFWSFCKTMAPDFYKESRGYLKKFCYALQRFWEDDTERVMIVNEPPRHGKSRTAQLFSAWVLGKRPSEKVIAGSYNEQLSSSFSRSVRNTVQERKAGERIVYSDVFPASKIKKGNAAVTLWGLEGQHISFLATSPTGTVTGMGGTLIIIDDIVKNAEEAYNDTILEQNWTWFTNTMLSRLEAGGKIIIIATRWHSDDLSGRALRHYEAIGTHITHISERALQNDGTMLCDEILNREAYDLIVKTMGREIVEANYNQVPIDMEGRLYQGFKTYNKMPKDIEQKCVYVDTADRGDDYLCAIFFNVKKRQAYVTDVYFTKDNMAVTEPELARRIAEQETQKAWIESNNGGRGFGRSVERILREEHGYYGCSCDLFFQGKNKKARILGAATWVQANVLFPEGWEVNYSEFYTDLLKYQKEGRAAHDDAEDALSGIYDKLGRGSVFSF